MTTIFGVLNKDSIHTDVSRTLLGAKQYATRNGYTQVSKRYGYTAYLVCEKINNKWINKQ